MTNTLPCDIRGKKECKMKERLWQAWLENLKKETTVYDITTLGNITYVSFSHGDRNYIASYNAEANDIKFKLV